MSRSVPPMLADLLACPQCHGPLDDDFRCGKHGQVGHDTLGILDFTDGPTLPSAGGAVMDLADEEIHAARLVAYDATSQADLLAFSGSHFTAAAHSEKFAAKHDAAQAEAGDRHGAAILSKVDAYLTSIDHAPAGGGWCLEAGGGSGQYLKGFSERFEHVVFVDVSLVALILARQLAKDQGLTNVEFIRADVTALPFKAEVFDFIHQNGVIEHVHDPDAMVAEALRVKTPAGVYACLSPNRYPITPEGHFRLPLFGAFPKPIRARIIYKLRGVESEAGTDLRSLRQLRRTFRHAGQRPPIFFLPPTLPTLARSTPLRRAIQRVLDNPVGRRLVLATVNGPLLTIAPYHIAVVT